MAAAVPSPPASCEAPFEASLPTSPAPSGASSSGLRLAEAALQGAREAVVLVDADLRIRFANAAAQQLFGAAAGDAQTMLVGRPLMALLKADAGGEFLAQRVQASQQAGQGTQAAGAKEATRAPELQAGARALAPTAATSVLGWLDQTCTGLRSDGAPFALQCRWVALSDAAPGPARQPAAAYAVFIHDLQEETALTDELQFTQRRLQTLVDLAPIAIWVAENDCVVVANVAAAHLLGVPQGRALQGQSVYQLLHADAHRELRACMAHALQHVGELEKVQARVLRADGQLREVEIALAALPDHGRTTVQMVVNDVTQRNGEVRELERSRLALKRLSASVVEAREAERKRIARELHDELGQSLSALKMEVADCANQAAHALPAARAQRVLRMVDDLVKSVRRIAADLRPLMLDDLGLGDAIESLAHDFAQRQGLQLQLKLRLLAATDAAMPGDRVATALYRIVQEALTNVQRHAQARHVQIELVRQGAQLVLSVSDDGVGLPEPAPEPVPAREGPFGLLGMRERAEALGGTLELLTPPEGGTCVRVSVPLPTRTPTPAPTPVLTPVLTPIPTVASASPPAPALSPTPPANPPP